MDKQKVAKQLLKIAKSLVSSRSRVSFIPQKQHYDGRSGPRTPWGNANYSYSIAKGVTWYMTPGHGGLGISLSVAKRSLSDEAIALGERDGGSLWYEEDVDWAIPFYENPKWEKIMAKIGGGGITSQSQKEKTIRSYHPQYFGEEPEEEIIPEGVTKIRSAISSVVRGIVVGITAVGDKVLVFKKEDYDSRGNLSGEFVDVTSIARENGFYLLGYKGDDDDPAKKKLINIAKKFLRT